VAARVISFINLKGGVGKTTLALAAGEILAGESINIDTGEVWGFYKKTLLIDLDGQANLTFAALDEDKIRSYWEQKKSTYHFFLSLIEGNGASLRECICSECSNLQTVSGRLHILPSSFELFNFEEKVLEGFEEGNGTVPLDLLRRSLESAFKEEGLLEDYDYIIIDCPPNLSVLTANAILASDYYVVPVIPEKLSTYGLQLIKRRVSELREQYPAYVTIEYAGAVLNRVDTRRKDHIEIAENILMDRDFNCFRNWIGDWKPLYIVTDFKKGREFRPSTPYQKYGGKARRKQPQRSRLLSGHGDGNTNGYIRIYERIEGFVEELISRAR
jgi:chromosome partitioning protein